MGDCKEEEKKCTGAWFVPFTVLEPITVMFQRRDPCIQFILGITQALKKLICPLVLPKQPNTLGLRRAQHLRSLESFLLLLLQLSSPGLYMNRPSGMWVNFIHTGEAVWNEALWQRVLEGKHEERWVIQSDKDPFWCSRSQTNLFPRQPPSDRYRIVQQRRIRRTSPPHTLLPPASLCTYKQDYTEEHLSKLASYRSFLCWQRLPWWWRLTLMCGIRGQGSWVVLGGLNGALCVIIQTSSNPRLQKVRREKRKRERERDCPLFSKKKERKESLWLVFSISHRGRCTWLNHAFPPESLQPWWLAVGGMNSGVEFIITLINLDLSSQIETTLLSWHRRASLDNICASVCECVYMCVCVC